MKTKLPVLLTIMAISLGGCAHGLMRGSVAMKTSDNEAHVCMGHGEVKAGDKVIAFKNKCPVKGNSRIGGTGTCEKVRLGEGTVTQVLNDHYSVVTFESGVQFDEGTFVEKL